MKQEMTKAEKQSEIHGKGNILYEGNKCTIRRLQKKKFKRLKHSGGPVWKE